MNGCGCKSGKRPLRYCAPFDKLRTGGCGCGCGGCGCGCGFGFGCRCRGGVVSNLPSQPKTARPELVEGRVRTPVPTTIRNFPTRPKSGLSCRMKTYPRTIRRPARHVRVPAFSPVPLRRRGDGWTPSRQAAFLAALAETGSVCTAARRVRMARETAYRLRRKHGAESFAAAWDAVLGRAGEGRRKVTAEERARRALYGLLKPVFYRGQHVATAWKADNSALLGHLSQLNRAGRAEQEAAERSQGFTPGSVSPPQAGNAIRDRLPDRPGRSRTDAPSPACRGAGRSSGTRR